MAEISELESESLVPGGGLEKTVVRKGDGDPAGKDAYVSLRYSMRLENAPVGQNFDSSSKRRNGLLDFRLGTGKVIPAMELIAASMAAGEKCEVTCAPSYAFGEKGLRRKGVPANAKIVISAEMVSFEGGTQRKRLEEMSPLERYSEAVELKEKGNKLFKETKFEKAVAEYSKAIRLLSQVFYQPMMPPSKSDDKPSETIPVSESGEVTARVPTEEGELGAATDKGAADEPEVLDMTGDQASPVNEIVAENDVCTNDEEGFQEAQIIGNGAEATAYGEHSATEITEIAPGGQSRNDVDGKVSSPEDTDAVQVDEPSVLPSEVDVLDLHVKTLNNLSLCCIKMGEFNSAVEGSSIAIRMDPKNSKAFYNRGRARTALGKLEEARGDFQQAAKINPRNMGIRNGLETVEKKLKQQKAKERKQAEAMFA